MIKIYGKPILAYTFDVLPDEVDEVIVIINYLGEQIVQYFGDHYNGKTVKYVWQNELNGTGGAIHQCRHLLRGRFMVLNGDDLYHHEDLLNLAREEYGVLAYEVEDPTRFGVFKIDSAGHLLEIVEKPQTTEHKLINIGAYVLTEKFFDYPLVAISDKEFGLPQTLASMTNDVKIKIIPATFWYPIGYPHDIAGAEEILASKK